MDERTGEIGQFESDEKARQAGYDIPLGRAPRRNCKRCYGRGHLGRNVDTGKYLPCPCTKPR